MARHYFRFIGLVELISWATGVILYVIFFNKIMESAGIALTIIYLVMIIVLGPALGLLFWHYGSSIPKDEDDEALIEGPHLSVGDKVELIEESYCDASKSIILPIGTQGVVKLIDADVIDVEFEYNEHKVVATIFRKVVKKI